MTFVSSRSPDVRILLQTDIFVIFLALLSQTEAAIVPYIVVSVVVVFVALLSYVVVV